MAYGSRFGRSEGALSVCSFAKATVAGWRKGKEDANGEEEVVGLVYMVTALSCRKLASSWGEYMGSLR